MLDVIVNYFLPILFVYLMIGAFPGFIYGIVIYDEWNEKEPMKKVSKACFVGFFWPIVGCMLILRGGREFYEEYLESKEKKRKKREEELKKREKKIEKKYQKALEEFKKSNEYILESGETAPLKEENRIDDDRLNKLFSSIVAKSEQEEW